MKEESGWLVPSGDTYFGKILPKSNGFQREHLLEAFKYVKKWRVAVDCGAHVGFWTRDMAERFEKVYAFEPAFDTVECLKENMKGFSNVEIHQKAVGPRPGKCSIVEDISRPGNTGSRFISPGDGHVRMVNLDSLKLPCCDLLKMDVEGYELGVLRGATEILVNYRPVVIMETDKSFHSRFGFRKNAAQALLEQFHYREVWHERPDKVFVAR